MLSPGALQMAAGTQAQMYKEIRKTLHTQLNSYSINLTGITNECLH